jgi:SAM-dependent methyltransferase
MKWLFQRRIVDRFHLPPTREDVLWCYRTFLQRDPESEQVIDEHLATDSFDTVVRVFVNSPEFLARDTRPLNRVPNDVAALTIQTRADEVQLRRLVARIRLAWTRLGESQPYFSVMTHTTFLPENIDQSIDYFFEVGERSVREELSVLKRHGLQETRQLTCVEFGCGVGRMTRALSSEFGKVIGYDISSAHLAHANARLSQDGISNVRLIHCADNVLQPIEPCDVFLSVIVLQHNPPPVIRHLIDNALAALRPGGLALFQVPTYIVDYSYNNDTYLAQSDEPGMEMHCLPQHEIFALARARQCEILEVFEDNMTGRPELYVSNTFVIRRPTALLN